MKITMVKKILADGSPCKKCDEVIGKMEADNYLALIDRIVVADEADSESEGMLLAKQHKVERAPFFIVEDDDGNETVYTIYFKLVKEVFTKS